MQLRRVTSNDLHALLMRKWRTNNVLAEVFCEEVEDIALQAVQTRSVAQIPVTQLVFQCTYFLKTKAKEDCG
jgi:hypothetical protein